MDEYRKNLLKTLIKIRDNPGVGTTEIGDGGVPLKELEDQGYVTGTSFYPLAKPDPEYLNLHITLPGRECVANLEAEARNRWWKPTINWQWILGAFFVALLGLLVAILTPYVQKHFEDTSQSNNQPAPSQLEQSTK